MPHHSQSILISAHFPSCFFEKASGPATMWHSSSHLNTELKQHWTRKVLRWEAACELSVLLAWVWISMLLRGELTVSNLSPYWLHSVSVHLKYLQTVKATPAMTQKVLLRRWEKFCRQFFAEIAKFSFVRDHNQEIASRSESFWCQLTQRNLKTLSLDARKRRSKIERFFL